MPSHYGGGGGMRKMNTPKTTARKMPAKKTSGRVSEEDRKRLDELKGKGHSGKHITIMRRELRAGKTFGQAHKTAMKEHGK